MEIERVLMQILNKSIQTGRGYKGEGMLGSTLGNLKQTGCLQLNSLVNLISVMCKATEKIRKDVYCNWTVEWEWYWDI